MPDSAAVLSEVSVPAADPLVESDPAELVVESLAVDPADESPGAAAAIPCPVAIAVPTPSATAKPPTRPTASPPPRPK